MGCLSIINTMLGTAWANWSTFFQALKEKALLVIGVVFAAFRWLFDPNPAWGSIWVMFIFSFLTKMMEISYNAEKEKFCKETFKANFSSSKGLAKFVFKVGLFTITMTFLAHGRRVNHQLFSWVEPGVLTLIFTNEGLNNYKHLSVHPGVQKLASAVGDVFKGSAKKVVGNLVDKDD